MHSESIPYLVPPRFFDNILRCGVYVTIAIWHKLKCNHVTCGVMCQGVDQHCMFFKSVSDAHALRQRVSECFERAVLPHTSQEERQQLLSFVVCGGGPTGVEVAAELHDMVHQDMVVGDTGV
jgi:hypothetical protein